MTIVVLSAFFVERNVENVLDVVLIQNWNEFIGSSFAHCNRKIEFDWVYPVLVVPRNEHLMGLFLSVTK